MLPTRPVRLAAGRDVPGLCLDALLEHVGMTPEARCLVAGSEDGRTVLNVSLSMIHHGVILYRVGKQPLPRGLGGPLRLVVARLGEVKALASLYVCDSTFMRDDETEPIRLAVSSGRAR
jgi:hypothetical protein